MNKAPFFSICIPAYNAEKTIATAILSLTKQKISFDVEIIVIDDGSKDATADIVNDLCKTDKRIKLYSRENRGTCYTRVQFFSLVNGKYILSCDADDTYVDGSLEKLYQVLYDGQYDLLFYGYNSVFQGDIAQEHLEVVDRIMQTKSPKECVIYEMLANHAMNSVCFKSIKRECLPINMDFSLFYKIKNSEDRLISYFCSQCATNIGCLREGLYNYYMNPVSVTHVANPKRYEDFFLAEQAILNDLHERKMDDKKTLSLYANGSIRHLMLCSIIEILRSNATWKEKYSFLLGVRESRVVDELYSLINTKGLILKHKLVINVFRILMIGR